MLGADHLTSILEYTVPPALLRSSLRTLVSQGPTNQQAFVEHVRKQLSKEPHPPLTDARVLFPQGGVASRACLDYVALTRCFFSSKLAVEAIP